MALLLCCGGMQAQEHNGSHAIEFILQQIEENNKALKANKQLVSSQKLENRAANNLPNPQVSYAHLWDSKNNERTVGELVVSQGFDFPTLYVTRHRMNQIKEEALDAEARILHQDVLLQAQEICLDIIHLYQQQQLLSERQENAEELSVLYAHRLETGDANILEINKLNLELLNVKTEACMNRTALENKLKELQALNGNCLFGPGRPMPDMQTPSAEALGLTAYPIVALPTDFRPLCSELLTSDPSLQVLKKKSLAAHKQLSVNRQGWLPKLEVGYKRNTESGHPLNGVVVGFSLPIFENSKRVKIAKAQIGSINYQVEDEEAKACSRLWQLYEEAVSIHQSMTEFRNTLQEQQNLNLLKQALEGGEISLIEYFVEVSVVYQSQANLLLLENQYQKTMARIYKSKL